MCGEAVVLVSYPSRDSMDFWSVPVLSFSSLFLSVSPFASFSRGQPPARRTKVVDDNLRPLKSGSTCLCVPVCAHDAVSSKPTTLGRDAADLNAHTTCGCVVSVCGSLRCKTCKHKNQA